MQSPYGPHSAAASVPRSNVSHSGTDQLLAVYIDRYSPPNNGHLLGAIAAKAPPPQRRNTKQAPTVSGLYSPASAGTVDYGCTGWRQCLTPITNFASWLYIFNQAKCRIAALRTRLPLRSKSHCLSRSTVRQPTPSPVTLELVKNKEKSSQRKLGRKSYNSKPEDLGVTIEFRYTQWSWEAEAMAMKNELPFKN